MGTCTPRWGLAVLPSSPAWPGQQHRGPCGAEHPTVTPGRTGPPQASCKTHRRLWREGMQGVIFMRYGAIPGTTGALSQSGGGCTPAVNRLQHSALGYPCTHQPPPQILALNTQYLRPFWCLSLWKPLLTVLVQAEPVCAAASPLPGGVMAQSDAWGGGPAGPSCSGISRGNPSDSLGERKGSVGNTILYSLLLVLET